MWQGPNLELRAAEVSRAFRRGLKAGLDLGRHPQRFGSARTLLHHCRGPQQLPTVWSQIPIPAGATVTYSGLCVTVHGWSLDGATELTCSTRVTNDSQHSAHDRDQC